MKKNNTKKVNDNKTPETEIIQPHLVLNMAANNNMMEVELENASSQTCSQIILSPKGPDTQDKTEVIPQNTKNIKTTSKNFSTRRNEINNINYEHLFYLTVDEKVITDIIKISGEWNKNPIKKKQQ